MELRAATLFRRTGAHSYAVQVHPFPGVVQIHCTEEDMHALHSDPGAKERLLKLGTVNMFSVSSSSFRAAAGGGTRKIMHAVVNPFGPDEGVRVTLGPYDPSLHAFVHCKLVVSGPFSLARSATPDSANDTADAASVDRNPSVPKIIEHRSRRSRRVFPCTDPFK